MRIAVVADESIPVEGWSKDPHVLTEGLRARGHQVTLLLVAGAESAPHLPVRDRPAPDGYLSSFPAEAQRGVSLFTVGPEVVISLGMSSPAIGVVLAESLGIPLVVCLPPELFTVDPAGNGYGRLLCRYLPCALLFVESDRHAAAAERLGADPHRTCVVRPGVQLDEFDVPPGSRRDPGPGVPSDDRLRLMFDASRTPREDQQFLEEVLTRLKTERGKDFHTIVLPGRDDNGDRSPDLNGLWRSRPDTTVTDLPSSRDVPKAYGGSDVVLVPSATIDETASVLRAMAAGRAVVAADSLSVQDVVGTARNGMLARAGNPDEWVDKLDYLLDGAALRLHIGRGARARVETHFSLPQTISQMEARLEAVRASWRYHADRSTGP